MLDCLVDGFGAQRDGRGEVADGSFRCMPAFWIGKRRRSIYWSYNATLVYTLACDAIYWFPVTPGLRGWMAARQRGSRSREVCPVASPPPWVRPACGSPGNCIGPGQALSSYPKEIRHPRRHLCQCSGPIGSHLAMLSSSSVSIPASSSRDPGCMHERKTRVSADVVNVAPACFLSHLALLPMTSEHWEAYHVHPMGRDA